MSYGDEFSAETAFRVEPSDNVSSDERPSGDQQSLTSPPARGSVADATILVGVIDADPFIRDCITISLKGACQDVDVVTFAECREVLVLKKLPDVIIYRYAEPDDSDDEIPFFDQSLLDLMKEGSLILLSTVEHPEIIIEAFENGARGYVPTKTATVGLVIEIIRLVKAGGTFVPRSGLPSRGANGAGETAPGNAPMSFTPREMAVLSLLKRGKANKIIAHELNISESTVKIHIRSIMRKLKVTNRTAVVSRLYLKKMAIGL